MKDTMKRSHIWQGLVNGGALDGRMLIVTERDGTDVYIVSHFVPGVGGTRRDAITFIVRGEAGLDAFLDEHEAKVAWRRLWRSPPRAA